MEMGKRKRVKVRFKTNVEMKEGIEMLAKIYFDGKVEVFMLTAVRHGLRVAGKTRGKPQSTM